MDRLVTRNEIEFDSPDNAMNVAKVLMNEGYVVLLSKEYEFTVVNYIHTINRCDRNDVIFLNYEEFYEKHEDIAKEFDEIYNKDRRGDTFDTV